MHFAKRVAFVGSKALGARVLEALYTTLESRLALVVTCDDSSDQRSTLPDLALWCSKASIPLAITSGRKALQDTFHQYAIDCAFVAGWYQLIPAELLRNTPGGFYGLHGSILPKLRGNAPLVWTILTGETESGVSLFKFDEGMDTGEIIAQEKFGIDDTTTISDLLQIVTKLCEKLILENGLSIANGIAKSHAQNHDDATYAAARLPEDGRISWHESATAIDRLVRAIGHPYPGAFTTLPSGNQLKITKTRVFKNTYYGFPGQAVHTEGHKRLICCGNSSALFIDEVELDGVRFEETDCIIKYGSRLS